MPAYAVFEVGIENDPILFCQVWENLPVRNRIVGAIQTSTNGIRLCSDYQHRDMFLCQLGYDLVKVRASLVNVKAATVILA